MKKLLFLLVAALSTTFSMNAVSLDTLFEYAESEIGGELTTIKRNSQNERVCFWD